MSPVRDSRCGNVVKAVAGVAWGLLLAGPVLAQPPATPAPPVQTAPVPSTLPGGASQIQETFGDWRVTCVSPAGTKICALSQQLADPNTRQLVVGIELRSAGEKAEGNLVLPFGLAVEKPVTMQIDSGAPITTRVRTCLPVGCVATVAFDASVVTQLRQGTALAVKATSDAGTDVSWRFSLKGFGGALDRTAVLSK